MVTQTLDPNAVASATSITFQQKAQTTGAFSRDEKILVIGNYTTDKSVVDNQIKQFFNADDVATYYGFGSPLHRMAMKLFPNDNNGSKVSTYFMGVDGNGTSQVMTVGILSGTPTKNFTCYLRFKELIFEAPADVVGKIATSYQVNPAKAPRKMDLNIFNKVKIPFTIEKDFETADILQAIKSAIDEYVELPFTAVYDSETSLLSLTSKWKGETASFSIDFVNSDNEVISTSDYGIAFTTEVTSEASGVVDLDDTLDVITVEDKITRIVSQFNDTDNLDKLKDKCLSFRDGLICQWLLAYTGKVFTESTTVSGTVDIDTLITFGNNRRDDSVNVIIAGCYDKELKSLTYKQRDTLLKAGITNLEPKSTGGYRIGDLITLYHPEGQKNPLYRFDRDITLLGNIGYDLMTVFRDSDTWKSIIIVSEDLITNNDSARTVKDVKAELDTRFRLYGKNAWIADVDAAIENSVVEIDSTNPNRFNINPDFDLSGVGRIYDITNFVGFYFGTSE
ncbi:MAG TPA: hypothetical protein VLL98_00145 [Rickettsiales bacterium]|nr:hypothetical protein [Rickettsiales bacterium]